MFPHPRRIVTGHNPDGAAVVVDDREIPCVPTATNANFAVLYETHQFPESNDKWIDPIETRTTDSSNNKRIVLRVVDIPPNAETVSVATYRMFHEGPRLDHKSINFEMFHRTESLDFGILHSGEITWYVSICIPLAL